METNEVAKRRKELVNSLVYQQKQESATLAIRSKKSAS